MSPTDAPAGAHCYAAQTATTESGHHTTNGPSYNPKVLDYESVSISGKLATLDKSDLRNLAVATLLAVATGAMADLALQLVFNAIKAATQAAEQAAQNQTQLALLAQKVQTVVVPQMRGLEAKVKGSKSRELEAALNNLSNTVNQIAQVIYDRGRPKGFLASVLGALTGNTLKVQQEIFGAEANLTQAMVFVNTAFLNESHSQTDAQLKEAVEKFNMDMQKGAGGGKQPWSLPFKALEVERKATGRPKHQLGNGAFGSVFKATYQGLEVAVKEPHDAEKTHKDKKMREEFMREATILFKMHHKNVVEFVGAILMDDDNPPTPFYAFVLEKLDVTLEDFIKTKEAKNASVKYGVILGAADGLTYLHSLHIIHRDIKPANLMLSAQPHRVLKYIDFGLSKIKEDLNAKTTGGMKGTHEWMAPEKKKDPNTPSGPWTDAYSLGLVMIHVLSHGEKPWMMRPPPPPKEVDATMKIADGPGLDVCRDMALQCSRQQAGQRPPMANVYATLVMKNPNSGPNSGSAASRPQSATPMMSSPKPSATPAARPLTASSTKGTVCKFFEAGNCKFGSKCKNLHLSSAASGPKGPR